MPTPSPFIPTLPPLAREFPFTDADFDRVRTFIRERAGISLAETKKDMVYGRLVRRVRALGLGSFNAYLTLLFSAAGRPELEFFVNALTTNLTFFFREEHHFPLLAEHLRQKSGDITIWCAASSTGEEPYTIAMTAHEATQGRSHTRVSIVATDLDTHVLATAAAGCYAETAIARLPVGLATRHFDRQPDGTWKIRPELRQMVRFQPLNLVEPNWALRGPFDAIFCRNVMIYFDRDTQLAILRRFAPLLKPDGLLFVGHSENFYHAADLFKLRGKTVYEKV